MLYECLYVLKIHREMRRVLCRLSTDRLRNGWNQEKAQGIATCS